MLLCPHKETFYSVSAKPFSRLALSVTFFSVTAEVQFSYKARAADLLYCAIVALDILPSSQICIYVMIVIIILKLVGGWEGYIM